MSSHDLPIILNLSQEERCSMCQLNGTESKKKTSREKKEEKKERQRKR